MNGQESKALRYLFHCLIHRGRQKLSVLRCVCVGEREGERVVVSHGEGDISD